MATAVAKPKAGATNTLVARFCEAKDFLLEHNVERNEEVELILLGVLAGVDVLFLGDPGVGKTYMLELFTDHVLSGAKLYNHMVFKESGVEELLGPRSIQALKQDKIERITEGFLPDADTAVIDEIFKGSAAVLNAMLDLFASRKLKIGGKPIDCSRLITILMASNELPEREDLLPFRDRIGITKVVDPVRTAEGRKRVRHIQLGQIAHGVQTNLTPLSMEEIVQARAEVDALEIPEAVGEFLDDAQEKWQSAGHLPSQRRMKQVYKVVKAHAWLSGRTQASADDLIPAQHMAWNNLDDAKSAREVILKYAGEFTRKAERLRGALEPVLSGMDDLKTKLSTAQDESDKKDLYTAGMSLLRELRGLGSEAKKVIADGQKQGQDVTVAEAILAEVEKANEWATGALMGEM